MEYLAAQIARPDVVGVPSASVRTLPEQTHPPAPLLLNEVAIQGLLNHVWMATALL